jgi:DNA-directed RNA polymerase subunit RPC12/RpoP
MAMGKCMECGNTVSDKARACPSCGAALTYGGRHPGRLVGAVAVVALLGIVGLYAIQANRISSLPPLPVEVKFRPSLLGARAGYVLVVENISDQSLPLIATVRHASVNDGKSYDLYVPPRSHTDIGKLSAGWTGEPGDRVTLENANYRPWSGSIPQ